jgi:hypothetical protein
MTTDSICVSANKPLWPEQKYYPSTVFECEKITTRFSQGSW